MKKVRKILAAVVAFAVLLGQVAVPNVTAKAMEPAKGNNLYLPVISDPIELNLFNSTDSASGDIARQIYRGLLRPAMSMKFEPDLAEAMPTFSKDHTEVTFKLKKNVKWDDNQPLTADDVKFSFDWVLNKATAAPRGGDIRDAIESVSVIDKYTVKFKMTGVKCNESVYSTFTSRYVVPEHLWSKLKPEDNMTKNPYNKKPVGCGQYKFVEWIPNERVVLEKNPLFEGTKPKIDKLIFKNVASAANIIVNLKTQEGDAGGVPAADVAYMRTVKHVNLYQYDRFNIEILKFNTVNSFFSDVKVRQAVQYAINKTAIINGLYKGLGKPAASIYYPKTDFFNSKIKLSTYDIAKAKKLLDAAGWKVGSDGIREKNGKKFEVVLCTNKGNNTREKAAVIVQAQLKLVGIKVDTRVVEWNTFITKYLRPKKFDLYYGGWVSSDWTADQTALYHSNPDKGSLNYGSYKNTELDKLMEDAVQETDDAKAKVMHNRIQEILANDVADIYLLYGKTTLGVNKRVSGVKFVSGLGINYEYTTWTIKD